MATDFEDWTNGITFTDALPLGADLPDWTTGVAVAGSSTSSALSLISRQTLAAAAPSVTFSAIVGTFENLILELVARTTATGGTNDNVFLTFNGDTAAHYDYNFFQGVNSTTWAGAGGTGAAEIVLGEVTANGAIAGAGGQLRVTVGGYARTTFWKMVTTTGTFSNTNVSSSQATPIIGSGTWKSTAAITSITLVPQTGPNFVAGSVFSLYGES